MAITAENNYRPRGVFERFLWAFSEKLSRPGSEKSAMLIMPVLKWLLNKPGRYSFDFAGLACVNGGWLTKYCGGRLLGELAGEHQAQAALTVLKILATDKGLVVDGAARGLATLQRRGLANLGDLLKDPSTGVREAAVLSIGVRISEMVINEEKWIAMMKDLEMAALDPEGKVHRHVGAGLLGRLLYPKVPERTLELIDKWLLSSNERLRLQTLLFYRSPAGRDPASKIAAGLEILKKDPSPLISKMAAETEIP